jgi:hypothetical protein
MYVAGIRFAVFVIELLLLSFNSFCAVGRVGVFECANVSTVSTPIARQL